jgi:transposase
LNFDKQPKEKEMQPTQATNSTLEEVILAVSLELSKKSWKIALHEGKRDKPAIYTVSNEVAAERLKEVVKAVEEVKRKWKLNEQTRTVMMYEAGQDGFWIHRALSEKGYEVLVIDPASIPVERHARRAKTDRLDAIKLVNSLRAWLRGERDRMHVIRIPEQEKEAQRHVVRDRGELQKEVTQHRDRMRKLLRTVGCWDAVGAGFEERLKQGAIRCHDAAALPRELHERLKRECERLALAEQQLAGLEKAMVQELPPEVQERIAHLMKLKGIGEVGAIRIEEHR